MQEVRREDQGLYRREFEHDNCGIGAVVNIKGKKTHDTVANALRIVEHLEHRAGKDAEGKTGDGVGILLQISHKFFQKACKKEGFDIGGEREYGGRGAVHAGVSPWPCMPLEIPIYPSPAESLWMFLAGAGRGMWIS